MTAQGLTAIVLTLNEERHLPGCLESLSNLTPDVIVLDSGSSDRTEEIARCHRARFIAQPFTGFASQRNAALDLAADAEWIFFVDADERVSPDLGAEIKNRLTAAGPEISGILMARRNIAFGRTLRGGGWWPDYQARIIRAGCGRYDESWEVHEVVIFDGPTGLIDEPLVHLNYDSRREFMHKQREYSLHRARTKDSEHPRMRSYVGRPTREFVRRFIALRGYRDGLDGLFMASVMALEELRLCFLTRNRGKR